VLRIFFHLIYALTFIPKATLTPVAAVGTAARPVRGDGGYARLDEGERVGLGVASEDEPPISKLLLLWVNSLVAKGRRGLLETAEVKFIPIKYLIKC